MSRPIKFRGKRIDNGEWVYGNLLAYGCERFISTGAVGKLDRYISSYIAYSTFKVDPATVGQYTGLMHSKKETFQGDLFKDSMGIWEVCWNELTARWVIDLQGFSISGDIRKIADKEAIGNIHSGEQK